MRALIQRVSQAQVEVNQETLSVIGPGLLVFLGVTHRDTAGDAAWLAGKISRLRIFKDDSGKMNRSVQDIGGSVLVVSQFTLYGDARHGNRPGFDQAALPDLAEPLYHDFCRILTDLGLIVKTGQFAADMKVGLVNDGPVTIWLETPARTEV
ncbi:MAG: D-aminoacyl-tRNA deacylase [Clostridiaceae bacterium]|nr:D-aminoacyl-tRNA deacylase [Clostridiaceae bacterium]